MSAYYSDTLQRFIDTNNSAVMDALLKEYTADKYNFLYVKALESWHNEIPQLKEVTTQLVRNTPDANQWGLLIEFWIPRRRKRCDVVILARDLVFVLEFKTSFSSQDVIQVEDYALELSQFHQPSHNLTIVPILVSPKERPSTFASGQQVQPVWCTTLNGVSSLIGRAVQALSKTSVQTSLSSWEKGEYRPVPTIVEAAQAMFAEMEVEDIARVDVDAKNLSLTIAGLKSTIHNAKRRNAHIACFVTGVPGAGKTLAGLRLVHDPELTALTSSHIAFVSGNGPLVKILQSALTKERRLRKNTSQRIAAKDPETLIQSVYSFKNTHWIRDEPPAEQVIVFDEAQRAWTKERNVERLKQTERDVYKKCDFSEPQLILHVLGRHKWSVLVALVGGGQEIHNGEAGLEEWGHALLTSGQWEVISSPDALDGSNDTSFSALFPKGRPTTLQISANANLHLDTATRQLRGKTINRWVSSLLAGQPSEAKDFLARADDFPVVIARDLEIARQWLIAHRRGRERCGLLASSSNGRLRRYGIDTDSSVLDTKISHWFLNDLPDYRSSSKLEVAVTEFQVQGLELDWVGVCWGGDLVINDGMWCPRKLVGLDWKPVLKDVDIRYLRNSYRVLLTRARKGLVVFVPQGDANDITLLPQPLDQTYDFLLESGALAIS
jgi:hypothetical protein